MKYKVQLRSILFVLTVLLSTLILSQNVLAADAGKREDALKWVYAQEGKSLDYDGVYGAQCVDLIKYYYAYFGKASYAKGNGCDYVSNALPDGWTRIKNTTDFVPQPGDIAVWGTELSKNGHVAIILSANANSFVSMDQNWPSGSPCKQVTHTYNNFWGVIRPNFTDDSGHNPTGNYESATGGICSVSVKGWAYDEDNTSAALAIHVYIGNEGVGIGTANLERTDVNQAHGCGNYHGFNFTVNLDKKYVGEQTVRLYAINVGGGTNKFLGEKKVTITADTVPPVISDCKVTNITSSGYTVSCKVTDNAGVDRVQFPTWTTYNGQDDICAAWQTNSAASGTKNGDIYTYQVNISDHNSESGEYNTHIYAYDRYGNCTEADFKAVVKVPVDPTGVFESATGGTGSITVKGWAYDGDDTSKALGIHVYIGNDGVGTGVANLQRTDINQKYGCGDYHGFNFKVNLDKKYVGEQTIRVYAINVGGGTNKFLGEKKVTITADTTPPVITDCKVTNISSSGYTVSCKATDNVTVDRVQFPTWTTYKEQDDICSTWTASSEVSGTKNGDIYIYQVKTSDHNNESGEYNTHIYAYDKYGNCTQADFKAKVNVPVDAQRITLDKTNLTFDIIGQEQTLKATVYPDNATDKTVKWSSASTKIATVSNGVVKAVSAGETTITATASNGSTAQCKVKVNEKKLTGITIATNPSKMVYYEGDSLDTKGLVLKAAYNDGSSEQIQSGFTCTPTVLNNIGTQKITVSYQNQRAVFNVTVKAAPSGKMSIDNVSGAPGESVKVAVRLDENPGIIAAGIKVGYDAEVLKLVKVEDGGILGAYTFGNDTNANPYTMLWEKGTVSKDYTATGNIAVLTFNIAENAKEGEYAITLSYDSEETYNVDLKNVKFSVDNGSVTVVQSVIQQGTCGTNLKWVLNKEGTLTISGSGSMKNYTYKSEMPWYSYNNQINSVVIEDGVTSIGDYAFYGMVNLKTIQMPEGVKSIGAYAFKNCTGLDDVNLPTTLTKLGESAFYGCSSLTSIAFPEGMYTIWAYTFKNCTSLTEVTFPSTLIKIDEAAFYGCKSIKALNIPDNVSIIGIYCFKNCSSLGEVRLPEKLTQIREAAFYGTAIKELTVPEGVTIVGKYAFKNCTGLKNVQLPSSLTKIDEAAFYACSSLSALNVPEKVESIGDYAFRRCEGLQTVSFPESLRSIGESAFYGCNSLSELEIPEGVRSIGGYAFKSCENIYDVVLPSTLETLGESVFYGCIRMSSIEIPMNVKAIGDYAFSRCSGLKLVVFKGNAPEIAGHAFASVKANVMYPGTDSTWTADRLQNYGGSLTWTGDNGNTISEETVKTTETEEIVETVVLETEAVETEETKEPETIQEEDAIEETEKTVLETEQEKKKEISDVETINVSESTEE